MAVNERSVNVSSIKFNEHIVLSGHVANFRSDDVLDLSILLAMALFLYLPM